MQASKAKLLSYPLRQPYITQTYLHFSLITKNLYKSVITLINLAETATFYMNAAHEACDI